MTRSPGRVGLIGGSGVYDLSGIEDLKEERLETPFGEPSDSYFTGTLSGVPVAFFSRHAPRTPLLADGDQLSGQRLRIQDARLRCDPLRVGGGKPEGGASAAARRHPRPVHRPHAAPCGHLLRARRRRVTSGLPTPCARRFRTRSRRAPGSLRLAVQRGGTYVCIEGPQFSTRAESNLYRSWGADVIGMTNLTEARARARGGALLRVAGSGDGLRLLARGNGSGVGRGGSRGSVGERLGRPPDDAGRGGPRRPGPRVRLPRRDAVRDHDRPQDDLRRGAGTPEPIAGRYL